MIHTIGHLTIDDIVDCDSGQFFPHSIGGAVLYSAIGAWLWYRPVGLVARASHSYSAENVRRINAAGIETVLVRTSNRDIRTWALYEPDGSRQFVYHKASGTYEEMAVTAGDLRELGLQGRGYHIASMPPRIQLDILRLLREQGGLISLDLFDQHFHNQEIIDLARGMLPLADLFLPSASEAALLHGRDDPEGAAHEFISMGPKVVAIKLGAEGSIVCCGEDQMTLHIPAYPAAVVDPTGAGDAFCGGFLAGYLESGDPVKAAGSATVSASFIVETVAALPALNLDLKDREGRLAEVISKAKRLA